MILSLLLLLSLIPPHILVTSRDKEMIFHQSSCYFTNEVDAGDKSARLCRQDCVNDANCYGIAIKSPNKCWKNTDASQTTESGGDYECWLKVNSICDSKFVDSSAEDTCTEYVVNNWCTAFGTYGPVWDDSWGTFEDYKEDDNTALVCPGCGCGLPSPDNCEYEEDIADGLACYSNECPEAPHGFIYYGRGGCTGENDYTNTNGSMRNITECGEFSSTFIASNSSMISFEFRRSLRKSQEHLTVSSSNCIVSSTCTPLSASFSRSLSDNYCFYSAKIVNNFTRLEGTGFCRDKDGYSPYTYENYCGITLNECMDKCIDRLCRCISYNWKTVDVDMRCDQYAQESRCQINLGTAKASRTSGDISGGNIFHSFVPYGCQMVPLCKGCDYGGGEDLVPGTFTLQECKDHCINDDECYGIDVGKTNGQCYKNRASRVRTWVSHNYDAYKKTCTYAHPYYIPTYTTSMGRNLKETKSNPVSMDLATRRKSKE